MFWKYLEVAKDTICRMQGFLLFLILNSAHLVETSKNSNIIDSSIRFRHHLRTSGLWLPLPGIPRLVLLMTFLCIYCIYIWDSLSGLVHCLSGITNNVCSKAESIKPRAMLLTTSIGVYTSGTGFFYPHLGTLVTVLISQLVTGTKPCSSC